MKLLSTETTSTGVESVVDGSSGDALTADSIQWLTREQTFVIVYLVSGILVFCCLCMTYMLYYMYAFQIVTIIIYPIVLLTLVRSGHHSTILPPLMQFYHHLMGVIVLECYIWCGAM